MPKTPEQRVDEEIGKNNERLIEMQVELQMTRNTLAMEKKKLATAIDRGDVVGAESHAKSIQSLTASAARTQKSIDQINHIQIGLKASKETVSVARSTASASKLYKGLNRAIGGERAMSMVGAYSQNTEDWEVTSQTLHGALDSHIDSVLDSKKTQEILEAAEESAALRMCAQLPVVPMQRDEPATADPALVAMYSKRASRGRRY